MRLSIFASIGLMVVAIFAADFSRSAETMLKNFDVIFKAKCSDTARRKAAQFEKMDIRHRNAVAIVNLYTQQCSVGTNGDNFYDFLNREIAKSSCHSVLREFEALLNAAIEILSKSHGGHDGTVYRGQCDSFPNGGKYTPRRFFSTSTRPYWPTVYFAWNACYVIISNAQGLNVEEFSDFPSEKEVLISSRASYYVEKKIHDSGEIYAELAKHGLTNSYLDYFIYKVVPLSTFVILKQKEEMAIMSTFKELWSFFKLWD